MAAVSARTVKQLREQTGAGMMDCKKALAASSGDLTKATEWLRQKGMASAEKKVGRTAAEGLVSSYIHTGGRVGVLVEVNCETDFVARGEEFHLLARDVAMQIAECSQKELDLPALLDQPFIKDTSLTVEERVKQTSGKLGEKIVVRRFARFMAAAEGLVSSYIHTGGRVGVLVEVNCETDFVARGEEFHLLARDVAMQIAACPQVEFVSTDHIPAAVKEREKAIETGRDDLAKKPPAIREKIVAGRIGKRLKELALLDQPFIKDTSLTVEERVKQTSGKLGGKIVVRRFARFVLGQGIEVAATDFAAEVAAMTTSSS